VIIGLLRKNNVIQHFHIYQNIGIKNMVAYT